MKLWPTLLVITHTLVAPQALSALLTKEQLMDIDENNSMYVKELNDREEWYKALADRAQQWGYNHAFATVLKEHERTIKAKEREYDRVLSFERISSLVQTGAARGQYLVGGIVDEIDASTESIDNTTIAQHDKAYRLVKYPYLSPSRPNWRDYLLKKQKIDIKEVPKELLPSTDREREIWKKNVDIGWERGTTSGYREIHSRWMNLYADLIGMTRYWIAVELNIIEPANVSVASMPIEHEIYSGQDLMVEEIRLNPTVIKIDAQSTFNPQISSWNAVSTSTNSNARADVRDAVIQGDLLIEDISDSQIIIETPDYRDMKEALPDDTPFRK